MLWTKYFTTSNEKIDSKKQTSRQLDLLGCFLNILSTFQLRVPQTQIEANLSDPTGFTSSSISQEVACSLKYSASTLLLTRHRLLVLGLPHEWNTPFQHYSTGVLNVAETLVWMLLIIKSVRCWLKRGMFILHANMDVFVHDKVLLLFIQSW